MSQQTITDAGNGGGDEGGSTIGIDGDYAIKVVTLGILNGGTEAGLVAGTGTGQRLDGNEVRINVLTWTRRRVTGRNYGNFIRVRNDTETAGVHGKD